MTLDIISLILIVAVAAIIGALLGLVLGYWLAPRKPAVEKKSNANWVERLRVYYDRRASKLVLEVDGKPYAKADEMSLGLHNRVSQEIEELNRWLGAAEATRPGALPASAPTVRVDEEGRSGPPSTSVQPAARPGSAGAPATVVHRPPVAAVSAAPGPTGSETFRLEPAQTIPLAPAAPERVKAPSISPPGASPFPVSPVLGGTTPEEPDKKVKPPGVIDILARVVGGDPNKAAPEKSIAAQVDDILQERLVNSPLANRGIRLAEIPGRGLVVVVGSEQYDGVGEVPYPEIRALIGDCVVEWEKRAYSQ